MSPLAKLDDAENAAFRAEVLHIMAVDARQTAHRATEKPQISGLWTPVNNTESGAVIAWLAAALLIAAFAAAAGVVAWLLP